MSLGTIDAASRHGKTTDTHHVARSDEQLHSRGQKNTNHPIAYSRKALLPSTIIHSVASLLPIHLSRLQSSVAMSKLSPTLKSLINAAHSRPGPVPAPPRIQAVYNRIEQEATDRKLGRPSWLSISTAATMTMNSPESMLALYSSSTKSKSESESVATAEFMREIGLKCIGFNGVYTSQSSL